MPTVREVDRAMVASHRKHVRLQKMLGGELKTDRKTVFSLDRKYRYTLWREWGYGPKGLYAMFIGLNPSTADETHDDPTVRRCIRFAKDWGYGAMVMTNIFAYRATHPEDVRVQKDPVGMDNDKWLVKCASEASIKVACWGTHGRHLDRGTEVRRLIAPLSCLGLTKGGSPRHPLYILASTKPVPFVVGM